jgi:radical SAM superfamily enzyme YgiQ (UPF0313 family)
MRIAIIATYTHATRLPKKERSVMQSAVPELIAGLCPADAEIELYNEKEVDVPLDREWDIVFFSYLHASYEHTKVLSALFRRRGMITVAGGRHAQHFPDDCLRHFDVVVTGDPEPNVPRIIRDLGSKQLQRIYDATGSAADIRPYRWDLIDYRDNLFRLPAIEASRGCPFSCNFCVLTGWEKYRFRPVKEVVDDIRHRLIWNRNLFGAFDDWFIFLDNNLGGSPAYLRELCQALIPLRKTWGCAVTFNVLRSRELVRLMAEAGCRYVYTGLESLDPESLKSMNKGQNRIGEADEVIRRCFSEGILLSFGLIVGADGDTNRYLERLPEYLAELRYFSITFLGIVCPYPETPFFQKVASEDRLLPGATIRDFDGYTVCHRPLNLGPDEVVDHFKRLCTSLGSFTNVARHIRERLGASDRHAYRRTILASGLEIMSVRNPLANPHRRYIAGQDPIEAWDARMMAELGLRPQTMTVAEGRAPAARPRALVTASSAG